ncbi:hypothetical protein D1872_316570 [compost metagenome]
MIIIIIPMMIPTIPNAKAISIMGKRSKRIPAAISILGMIKEEIAVMATTITIILLTMPA